MTTVLDQLKGLCARLDQFSPAASPPPLRVPRRAPAPSSPLGAVAAQLQRESRVRVPARASSALLAARDTLIESALADIARDAIESDFRRESRARSRSLLPPPAPAPAPAPALPANVARAVFAANSTPLQPTLTGSSAPTRKAPLPRLPPALRPRAHAPQSAASFLSRLRNDVCSAAYTAVLVPFAPRPRPGTSSAPPQSRAARRPSMAEAAADAELASVQMRLGRRRRNSESSAEGPCVLPMQAKRRLSGDVKVLLRPAEVAEALSGMQSGFFVKGGLGGLPPRPPPPGSIAPTALGPPQPLVADAVRATLHRLRRWVASQADERDRAEASWAAAESLAALLLKRRVLSRCWALVQRRTRARLMGARAALALQARAFACWRGSVLDAVWARSVAESADRRAVQRAIAAWRGAAAARASARALRFALVFHRCSASVAAWRDAAQRRRAVAQLAKCAAGVRMARALAVWHERTARGRRRTAAAVTFCTLRLREVALPRFFTAWAAVCRSAVQRRNAARLLVRCRNARLLRAVISALVERRAFAAARRVGRAVSRWRAVTAVTLARRAAMAALRIRQDTRLVLQSFARWRSAAAARASVRSSVRAVRQRRTDTLLRVALCAWRERVDARASARSAAQARRAALESWRRQRALETWRTRTSEARAANEVAAEQRLRVFFGSARRLLSEWRRVCGLRKRSFATAELLRRRLNSLTRALLSTWRVAAAAEHAREVALTLAADAHLVACRQRAGLRAAWRHREVRRFWRLQNRRATVHAGFLALGHAFSALRRNAAEEYRLRRGSAAFSGLAPRLQLARRFSLWRLKVARRSRVTAILARSVSALHRRLLASTLRVWASQTQEMARAQEGAVRAESFARRNALLRSFRAWRKAAVVAARLGEASNSVWRMIRRRRLSRSIATWVKAAKEAVAEAERLDIARCHHSNRIARSTLVQWLSKTSRRRGLRQALVEASRLNNVRVARRLFSAWRRLVLGAHARSAAAAALARHRGRARMRPAISAWALFASRRRRTRLTLAALIAVGAQRAQLRSLLSRWAEGARAIALSARARRALLATVLRTLQQHAHVRAARRRQAECLAMALAAGEPRILSWARLLARPFCRLQQRAQAAQGAQRAIGAHGEASVSASRIFRCFRAWAQISRHRCARIAAKTHAGAAARACLIGLAALRLLPRWRRAAQLRGMQRLGNELATTFCARRLQLRVFRAWRSYARGANASIRLALFIFERASMHRVFCAWAAVAASAKRAAAQRAAQRPLRDAFSAWRTFVRARALLRMWRSPLPHRSAQLGGSASTPLGARTAPPQALLDEAFKWRHVPGPDEDEEEPRSLVASASTSPSDVLDMKP